jgi:hypothetical protein
MFARIFSQEINPNTEKNSALIESTKKGFFPLCSTEVGLFHCVVLKLLEDLNPASKNFDYEYNQVVFGGMLIELAMETDKYYVSNKEELYAKTVGNLMKLCDIKTFPHPIAIWQPEDLKENVSCIKLIKGVGQRVLDGSLEFSTQHLEYHFQKSLQYLQNHHPGRHNDEHKENIIVLNNSLKERHQQLAPSSLKCSH